jgi:uncharacterized protein YlzI (FlbEa/FlbD family)
MAMLIPVTKMDGVSMLVNVNLIKMIEPVTEPVDPKDKNDARTPPASASTQPVVPAPAVPPVVMSKITFLDGKDVVVKELMPHWQGM